MADTSKRLAGIASGSIDGTTYQIVSDVEYSTSTVERESLLGMDGYHGYSEKPIAGYMAFKVRDNSGIRTSSFNAMTSSTVVIIGSNGKSVSGQNMVCMKAVEVKLADGTFDLRFEGSRVEES